MTKEEIGTLLKEARISSGKTQKEVAKIIGRTQQIIGHWETGYSQPDANTLFTLCDIYGTTVDEVFGFKSKITISKENFDLLKKYNTLDQYGKESVHIILERETERVKALAAKDAQLNDLQCQLLTQPIELEQAAHPRYAIPYYRRLAPVGSSEYLFDNIPNETIEIPATEDIRLVGEVLGKVEED